MKTPNGYWVDLVMTIDPQKNPDLRLPGTLSTRRGITVCGKNIPSDEEMVTLEVRGGLRALEHRIEQWQKEQEMNDE